MGKMKELDIELQEIEGLTMELQEFLDDNSLPQWSADDILFAVGAPMLSRWQRNYIKDFIKRWDALNV